MQNVDAVQDVAWRFGHPVHATLLDFAFIGCVPLWVLFDDVGAALGSQSLSAASWRITQSENVRIHCLAKSSLWYGGLFVVESFAVVLFALSLWWANCQCPLFRRNAFAVFWNLFPECAGLSLVVAHVGVYFGGTVICREGPNLRNGRWQSNSQSVS